MKIEVVHTIKFDTKVEGLLNLVAQAILGAASSGQGVVANETTVKESTTKTETQASPDKEDKPNVATKMRYFRHEGTDELITVKKGESLDFLENDVFDELSSADFNRLKAEQEKAAKDKSTENVKTEEPPTEGNAEDELGIADLRVVASKFVSAAKQKELKELFGEFNDANGVSAVKLSAIQATDYQAFMVRAKERLDELGVK